MVRGADTAADAADGVGDAAEDAGKDVRGFGNEADDAGSKFEKLGGIAKTIPPAAARWSTSSIMSIELVASKPDIANMFRPSAA